MATALSGSERSVWLPTWPRLTAPERLRPLLTPTRKPSAQGANASSNEGPTAVLVGGRDHEKAREDAAAR